MKYRKKPVVIEAIQFTGGQDNGYEILKLAENSINSCLIGDPTFLNDVIEIITLEGTMKAKIGDWIIKGVNGELYPCKPDIFEKTYEAVEE